MYSCVVTESVLPEGPPAAPMQVSVRALCAFAARAGDLDLRFTPAPTGLEGAEGHRRDGRAEAGDLQPAHPVGRLHGGAAGGEEHGGRDDLQPRHGGDEFRPLRGKRRLFRPDLVGDVPRQDEQKIGPALLQGFGRQDRDVAARHELALLGGRGVADEGQEVRLHAGVIEQRVALGGGPIGSDRFSGSLLLDEEA